MNRFTYPRVGAYWIPELKLTEQSLRPIGKCGRMRRRYLKECRPMLYSHLILTERLHPHLAKNDDAANRRMELLMPKLARDASATERLKASDPMAWVRRMNALKDQVRKSSAKH
ncbi:MAG: TnpV protein [Clostridiales bacterium]|nr:TnpV protein [Clostridiales bacterium]